MTHIRTEVSDEEYERLQQIADQQGLSIREALRQATELWLEEQEAIDTEDPLFTSVDDVRSTSDATEATSLSAEDDIVVEWAGDADTIDFEDPSE